MVGSEIVDDLVSVTNLSLWKVILALMIVLLPFIGMLLYQAKKVQLSLDVVSVVPVQLVEQEILAKRKTSFRVGLSFGTGLSSDKIMLYGDILSYLGEPKFRLINAASGELVSPDHDRLNLEDELFTDELLTIKTITDGLHGSITRGRGYWFNKGLIATWNTYVIFDENGQVTTWTTELSKLGPELTKTIGILFINDPAPEDRVQWNDLQPKDYPRHFWYVDVDYTDYFAYHGYVMILEGLDVDEWKHDDMGCCFNNCSCLMRNWLYMKKT